jgi:opacity protein-like surface antigen
MRRILKLTPLLGSVIALSACSALGLNSDTTSAAAPAVNAGEYGDYVSLNDFLAEDTAAAVQGPTQDQNYVKLASNSQTGTTSDYINSGWYTQNSNPYAGGTVTIDPQVPAPWEGPLDPEGVKTAHNGYHDAYGNPVPAPSGASAPRNAITPKLRGAYGPSYYGNIGGIMYDVDSDLFGLVGRLGVQKSWYGAEIEGTVGVSDEDETLSIALPDGTGPVDVDVSAGIDYSLAAFAVGRLPLGSQFKALGRVGYHTTQIGASANAVSGDGAQMINESDSDNFDGLAYGAGLEYDFDAVNGVRVDYTRYDLGDDAVMDSISATYLRRF